MIDTSIWKLKKRFEKFSHVLIVSRFYRFTMNKNEPNQFGWSCFQQSTRRHTTRRLARLIDAINFRTKFNLHIGNEEEQTNLCNEDIFHITNWKTLYDSYRDTNLRANGSSIGTSIESTLLPITNELWGNFLWLLRTKTRPDKTTNRRGSSSNESNENLMQVLEFRLVKVVAYPGVGIYMKRHLREVRDCCLSATADSHWELAFNERTVWIFHDTDPLTISVQFPKLDWVTELFGSLCTITTGWYDILWTTMRQWFAEYRHNEHYNWIG